MSDKLREALVACREWNRLHGNWSYGLEQQVEAALSASPAPARLTLQDILDGLAHASEERHWSGPKPDLLGNFLNARLASPASTKETAPHGIEFDLKTAQALLSMFGGEDTLISVTKHDRKLVAYYSEYPEEGAVELEASHDQAR